MENARLGWFSPLGVAFRFGDCRSAGWCFRSASWPSGSRLPLFGTHRFGDCCSAGWPSGSPLPLFGTHRFGVALVGLVLPPSASEIAAGRVGLRASVSGLPLGGLAFGLTASAFRHAPLRGCCSAGWPSGSPLPLFGTHRFGVAARRVGLRAHGFRFSARTASGLPSAGWPSGSRLSLFGTRRFGNCPRRVRSSAGRVGLRAHCFRFSARPASEITARRVGLRAHDFRFSACTASELPSAGWPSGSRLSLFGTHRSAPPHRRSEGRRSTPTRHLFHFKTLIPTC